MQFYIQEIKVDGKTGNIVSVAAFGKGEKNFYWVPRAFIAQMIRKGAVFNTLFMRNEKWVTGAKVEIYDETFLRTVANGTERDNLESLPTTTV